MTFARRFGSGLLALSLAPSWGAARAELPPPAARPAILYRLTLPNGATATVYKNGVARILSHDRGKVETRLVRPGPRYDEVDGRGSSLPSKSQVAQMLAAANPTPFVANRVIVAYRDGVRAPQDTVSVGKSALIALRTASARRRAPGVALPAYTNDARVNAALARLGVDRSERLFRRFNRSTLAALRSDAETPGTPAIDLGNVYRLHVSDASVRAAVSALSKLPSVAYVSPDWSAGPAIAPGVPLRANALRAARERSTAQSGSSAFAESPAHALPSNYALRASAQSMLNAPGVDAAAAYAEIASHFTQLPGQGETITNVSLGDLDDASAATNITDPCFNYVADYGPTTVVQGNQRYLDLPSMPLIPTYTSDDSGTLDGTGEVCGIDPSIAEIGLDFSMMAPLPHNLQRPGEQGAGYADLLGIAPGANYRLIVPGGGTAGSDVDAALLAAALQTPRPDVITASIGFSYDSYGFPSRFLEEDPLAESIVHAIVSQYHIVVCISSGDGTRMSTPVAIGPSGGSAATGLATGNAAPTSLSDDYFSTTPSRVLDSGSIDVGGTTLDDIFSNPPQYAATSTLVAQHAYAETRWTGFTDFSSGFGARVDVSAPSDNVLSLEHDGKTADAVSVAIQGGTSASAPETAAAAAVALQVARLTGHPFASARAVRTLLERTGRAVPNVAQADRPIRVGPQIDLRAAVESLLANGGVRETPAVARVAVEQRRDYGNLDAVFVSDTNPAKIEIGADPLTMLPDQLAWITIAPDWEFLPKNATYRLFVSGHPHAAIATTPWARVQAATILQAAGLPSAPSSSKTVELVYEAFAGARSIAKARVPLTFTAATAGPVAGALAPNVPPVVSGTKIPVKYDVSNVANLANPQLIVSEPGRVDPATGQLFHPAYTVALPSRTKGTVEVPVSALQGGGIYGIGILLDSTTDLYSDFAFTRVTAASARRPAAPLLSSNGSPPGHVLEIPYGGSFTVHYDVSNVPGATGARLEISAGGPGGYNIYNPFNNPNGTIEDDNGVDRGSIYDAPLSGTSGNVTLAGVAVGLFPGMNHVVRIVPMRYGRAAGEAGDVSTIAMDGVVAADGGFPSNGWGINFSGTDGFLVSDQATTTEGYLASVETFDQTNNQIVQTAASTGSAIYVMNGWGLYAGDVGLYGTLLEPQATTSYNLLNTVASGKVGQSWTPPLPVLENAANQVNDTAIFVTSNRGQYNVYTSNILANTFTGPFDASTPISSFVIPVVSGFAANTTTNTAVMPVIDLFASNGPPTLVTVDLTAGTVSSFAGLGSGMAYGIAIDSTTNKAAVPTENDGGFSIYNLATKTGTEYFLPQPPNGGGNGLYTFADPQAGRFLVAQTVAPGFLSDNNNLSQVLVYDESGNLQETIERFDLFGAYFPIATNDLQVKPGTGQGYMIGPLDGSIVPFKY